MSARSANQLLAIFSVAILCSACVAKSLTSASGIDSKTFQCHELKQLVAERQQVNFRGILGSSSSVFASSDACNIVTERPVPSAWRTSDQFSCVVGFRCLDNRNLQTDFQKHLVTEEIKLTKPRAIRQCLQSDFYLRFIDRLRQLHLWVWLLSY